MNAGPLTSLKVVQVSDCHLSADPDQRYRGLSADHTIAILLPALRRWQPDLILLTGDVSDDASPSSYGRISTALSSVGAPVLALPGNHDVPSMMKNYFRDGPWQGPLFRALEGWQLVLLDSTAPGEIGGVLSEYELEQLERGLRRSRSDHVLLALHHQPVPVGSPWIDRYALAQAQHLWDVLDREPRLRGVAWGHIHQDFTALRGKVRLFGAPSTVANSIPGQEKFTLDTGGPACRWFRLQADGKIDTGVLKVS